MIIAEILIRQQSNFVRINPLADELVNVWQTNIVMNKIDMTHYLHVMHQLK